MSYATITDFWMPPGDDGFPRPAGTGLLLVSTHSCIARCPTVYLLDLVKFEVLQADGLGGDVIVCAKARQVRVPQVFVVTMVLPQLITGPTHQGGHTLDLFVQWSEGGGCLFNSLVMHGQITIW